jgi:hypothetical protein
MLRLNTGRGREGVAESPVPAAWIGAGFVRVGLVKYHFECWLWQRFYFSRRLGSCYEKEPGGFFFASVVLFSSTW